MSLATSEDNCPEHAHALLATAAPPPRRLKSIAQAAAALYRRGGPRLLSIARTLVGDPGHRRGHRGSQASPLRDDARRRRDEGVRAMPRVPGPAALQVDPVQGHRGPVRASAMLRPGSSKTTSSSTTPASGAGSRRARLSSVYSAFIRGTMRARARSTLHSRRGYRSRGTRLRAKSKITREEISASPPRSESRRRTRRPSRP